MALQQEFCIKIDRPLDYNWPCELQLFKFNSPKAISCSIYWGAVIHIDFVVPCGKYYVRDVGDGDQKFKVVASHSLHLNIIHSLTQKMLQNRPCAYFL